MHPHLGQVCPQGLMLDGRETDQSEIARALEITETVKANAATDRNVDSAQVGRNGIS
jgi:hypothetical protein